MASLANLWLTGLPRDQLMGGFLRRDCSALALLALVVLEELHALECSGTAQELVRKLALVLVVTVDLAVRVVRVACGS
jgi:hypothetical protein